MMNLLMTKNTRKENSNFQSLGLEVETNQKAKIVTVIHPTVKEEELREN